MSMMVTALNHYSKGDLPQHLQVMINTLRSEDRIKLVVRLESGWTDHVRYMVVVYTNGRQDTEENILLGMDFTDKDSKSCSIGMTLPLWSDTKIHLDGDGGFSVSTAGRLHVFKPVSVQAMWSALQVLHKACEVSRRYNYFPGGMALTWVGYYESCISSEQSCINEWNAMTDLETTRPDSPVMFSHQPTERERTECMIKAKLRNIMTFQDLENITSKEIRNELEQHMSCNLREYKEFIDNEMLLILGQMDKATLIFDHLYLGSEWNASNLEELQDSGVGYILNVTREIDNFFPGTFCYCNIRVYDDETTDLLAHWNETYNFIVRAKKNNSKCLVHCKMGVSRSASTVIAYAMKEYGWSLEKAYSFVKQKRNIAQPNPAFMKQLAEYEGILDASKQRHNKLWQPDSDEYSLEGLQASAASGDQTPQFSSLHPDQEETAWGHGGASASPCCGEEPTDHLNYNYYFRRLSDTALDSEPSTPVRGPPLLGMERVFIEIEDVERDALLDDEGFPMAHLALPGEGTAAQTCGRLEPLEDMRLRLEFSTVEEEDEEEAQKEEAEMAALARGEEMQREDGSLANSNRFNNENANNSNRLAGKRSCPSGFDDSASIGNPYKVKPSYQSCRDCLRLPSGRRCERRTHRLNLPRHAGLPSISIQAPGGHKFSPASANKVPPPAPRHHMSSGHCQCIRCSSRANLDTYLKQPSCEDLPQDLRYSLETEDKMEGEDEGSKESSSSPMTELTLLRLSLGGERPMAELSQGVHLETQLVHHRLEQVSGPQSEQMDLSVEDTATEDMEVDEENVPNLHPGSSEFQQMLAPGSSLTRSSSSDSLQRIRRGQPGLVRQRAQEIETRVRLAGLTVSSQLKRSNSLAKLDDLAISTEDLTLSATVSIDYEEQEPSLCLETSCSPKLSLTPTVLQSLKS
ncbi:protein phosphatase Slingshot homolog 1 isoform X2 [Megalobrama amblycephala]|uniref:protein phosphatase Slingshot homolog 1 isoform X2 n=1 Tax=Megalobrama amblycephala TaxID=75352 RepID=UPI0020140459|nr:protein phosphatase Slingshot homolog 1 isoform X2 [Megalobrama amblycephala]XP_048043769.1 protein phosphatase Slingshot homolog 1 isoform X2 [Megalobrama amblycephala]XP_048043770.1 protein phosphatase Slingshot homolog 1 isoform X2 [Megalobrama amblycephala]